MSAVLKHSGLPEGVSRDDLISIVNAVGRTALKLSSSSVRYLVHCIKSCREDDFLPGRICGVWERAETIAKALGVSIRTVSSVEERLRKANLIARTGPDRSPRRGQRTKDGIQYLCGINLAPLVEKARFLIEQRNAELLLLAAKRQLRAEIAGLRSTIREVGDPAALSAAEQILPRGRTSRIDNRARLEAIKAELSALLEAITGHAGDAKTADRSADSCAPNILPEDLDESCSGGSAPTDRKAAITPARALALASDDYRALVEARGGPEWPSLIEASAVASGWHGISQRQWGEACQSLGRERAALCVLAIDRNARLPADHHYRGRSPGACLAGMVRKHRKGGFDPRALLGAIQRYREDGAQARSAPVSGREAAEVDRRSLASVLARVVTQAAHAASGGSL